MTIAFPTVRWATKQPTGERFRTFVETSRDEIFIVDRDNVFEYVNPAASEPWISTVGPVLGHRIRECFPGDIGRRLEEEINRARRSKTPIYTERRIPFPGGQRWMGAWLTPIEDAQGGYTSIMGVARDITQQHELSDLLAQQHHLLNALINASPIGIMMLSRLEDWVCELSNPVIRLLAESTWLDGSKLADAWPALAAPLLPIVNHVATLGRPEGLELELQTGSGDGATVRHLSITASRLQLPDRSSPNILILVSDVTDRKQLEQQLMQADKIDAVGRLAGGIAHDFNNLLTPILGYAELVQASLDETDRRREDLGEICTAARSASGLTRQLLTFSRKQVTSATSIDLNDVLASVNAIIRRTIGEDVSVRVNCATDLGCTIADRHQMEQVIMNLCVNARDAMPKGGLLTIQTANVTLREGATGALRQIPPGSYVSLRIADTGTGMTPQIQAHIFEPFFTTKGVGKGTGLGLAIVYGIVKDAGGYIALDTEPGQGTAFTIYLPRTEAPASDGVENARSATLPTQGRGETILVVEDHDGLRRLADRLLTNAGYHTLLARNAGEALQVVQAYDGPIHLLLSDIVMPGTDGLTLAQQLTDERPSLSVLFMSGYTGDHVARHGSKQPNRPLLQKPFTRESLTRAVRDALG